MKKDPEKKRKSQYNPDRPNYLSEDGAHYCYRYWDNEIRCNVTMELEVGKDGLTEDLAQFLDKLDYDADLNDRYQGELRDPLFESKVCRFLAASEDKDSVDPWDMLGDMSGNPETVLFPEKQPIRPEITTVRRVIEEDCTDSQREFIFAHFGECLQLEEMRQAEAERTGKLPSSPAMTNRKNKIVDKTAKALGVKRVKRRRTADKN